MNRIKIHDWEVWQCFRKDRGTPPWIKIHRTLLSCKKWAVLSDSEKGQLVSMWIVAADAGGHLPDDAAVIRKICQLDEKPNLIKFKELGLMTTTCQPDDTQMTTTCQPDDAPEESRVEESRVEEKERKKDLLEGSKVKKLTIYAFDGNHIKLNQKDFEQWKTSYHHIPDLLAELTELDAHLQDAPAKRKDWFSYISAVLRKRNQKYADNPPMTEDDEFYAQQAKIMAGVVV